MNKPYKLVSGKLVPQPEMACVANSEKEQNDIYRCMEHNPQCSCAYRHKELASQSLEVSPELKGKLTEGQTYLPDADFAIESKGGKFFGLEGKSISVAVPIKKEEPKMQTHYTSIDWARKNGVEIIETVPMKFFDEESAKMNHGQSLEMLNRRGGLSYLEMYYVISKKRWPTSGGMKERDAYNFIVDLLKPIPEKSGEESEIKNTPTS